jgi:hypothetical protein
MIEVCPNLREVGLCFLKRRAFCFRAIVCQAKVSYEDILKNDSDANHQRYDMGGFDARDPHCEIL